MTRRQIKRYALDLLDEMRTDVQGALDRNVTPVDLAEVVAVSPEILIEPHHSNVTYEEDSLMFNIDPDSLKVDDTVILVITPSNQPVVVGIADGNSEDPLADPTHAALHEDSLLLRDNTSHWKSSVESFSSLPLSGNDEGDLRYSLTNNIIYRWDALSNSWVAVSSTPVQTTVSIDASFSPYNLTTGINVIFVDSSLGEVTIILPSEHSNGESYNVKDTSGDAGLNNITIVSSDGDFIDGETLAILNTNYEALNIISNGLNWFLI